MLASFHVQLGQPGGATSHQNMSRRVPKVLAPSHQNITQKNNDNKPPEGSFLFQRLSTLIQRFNAVLLHECFVDEVAGHFS